MKTEKLSQNPASIARKWPQKQRKLRKKRTISPFLHRCDTPAKCATFGRNTLMYKQVACLFLSISGIGLPPAPALAQVTFSRDLAPVLLEKMRTVPPPWGRRAVQSLSFADARPRDGEFIGLDPLTEREIQIIEQWVSDGLAARHSGPDRVISRRVSVCLPAVPTSRVCCFILACSIGVGHAGVVKLADARDSKSRGVHSP